MEEMHMVVRIARRYHKRRLDFCIITFYDLQRSVITKALEAANLPSERVYNVDSFQGMYDSLFWEFIARSDMTC
jgi:regulator of nonsense transcripts 1